MGKLVIAIDDDRDVPLVGEILGWDDGERVTVVWGDSRFSDDPWAEASIVYADEVMPWGH